MTRNLGSNTGTIKKFELKFDKRPSPTRPRGTRSPTRCRPGSTSSSRTETSPTAHNWTPAGPIGASSVGTVGRVSAVTVDPSDPSGNTVYAAGASGGVWRTTNFLTRNVLGPNWVPLTDFGPNGSMNVGSIAIYPDLNGDPLKTTILVGTGSDSLNQATYDGRAGSTTSTESASCCRRTPARPGGCWMAQEQHDDREWEHLAADRRRRQGPPVRRGRGQQGGVRADPELDQPVPDRVRGRRPRVGGGRSRGAVPVAGRRADVAADRPPGCRGRDGLRPRGRRRPR